MATGKRYYWIKLKETFMTSDAVDFLMGQKDGANYVVLYQMLCLKTINTDGKLERHIGEIIIPYDEAKIQRDTKFFSVDTVRIALSLYKKLGLIYVDQNGTLCLTDHRNLVGSETDFAEQKRIQRSRPALPEPMDNVHSDVLETVHTDIEIDIRDKDIEIRDKENEKSKRTAPQKKAFVPPTREEVRAYAEQRNSPVDPDRFFDYFDIGNWHDAKGNPVKNWKQKFITWENKDGTAKRAPEEPVKHDWDDINFYDN